MNKLSNLNYLEQFNLIKFGHFSFCIGILFLPSALPVSFFFLIIALSISLKRNYKNILKDKWNYPLYLTAGVMVISCIFNNYLNDDYSSLDIAKSNNWLDLFNWLPLFLCFGAFQEYLKSEGQRNLFSKMLLIGSIPVLISFILQGWFSIYGPLKTLGGSIVWYQKPLSGAGGISGLFSNPNYAGFWIATILPFFVVHILNKKDKFLIRFFYSILFLFNIYFAYLTNSRNAFIGILSSILFLLRGKYLIITILFLIFPLIIDLTLNPTSVLLPKSFQTKWGEVTSNTLAKKLFSIELKSFNDIARIELWQKSLQFIFQKPFLGWGAATFFIIYKSYGGSWDAQHAHNLPLQISYSYGILVGLSLTLFVTFLLVKAYKKIIIENNLLEKSWLMAVLIAVVFHLSDIVYYDGKISLLIWCLLAGLKCTVEGV